MPYIFPTMQNNLLQAIDLALTEWHTAHQIVQQYEDATAAWIHAVLHKIEGDQDNNEHACAQIVKIRSRARRCCSVGANPVRGCV